MLYNFSRFLFLRLLLCSSQLIFPTHKIIIQVSPPRCLSTASLRAWQARGDFEVMNEPFITAFVWQDEDAQKLTSSWWRADAPRTFDFVHEKILNLAQERPLFIKEESFAIKRYLENYPSLIRNPNVYFIFLIRNPHHAISSFYKVAAMSDSFSYLAGFQPCYEVFQMVKQAGINKLIILNAEDVYTNPYETTQQLCVALDIPFLENMLQWDNLGNSFTGTNEWHELKNPELTQHWHGAAIKSTGFHLPATYELDVQGNPTFAEISNQADRAVCMQAYQANKIYYDLLRGQKELLTVPQEKTKN